MKKGNVIVFLLIGLLIFFAGPVLAAVVTPEDGTKNSDKAQYYDITKTDSTLADTYGNETPHGNYFYVPGANPGSQKIHANYSANTDACAACHFTHTAVGPRLLQWGSIYEACAACHDGSLGQWTYDVFSGEIGTTGTRTYGGLFGSTVDEVYSGNSYLWGGANPTSISNHMANGFMALSAAPGAEANAGENTIQFDCASCHTPHGQGGNARGLNPDPGKLKIDDFFPDEAAYPLVVNDMPNASDYIEALTTPATGVNAFQSSSPNWIQGYPYNRLTGVFVSSAGMPTFKFNPNDAVHKGLYTETANVTTLVYGVDYSIDWRKGIVDIKDSLDLSGKTVYAVRVPGIFVAMKIENYLQSNEKVDYVELAVDQNGYDGASDPNQGINAFCGACHGKYNTQGKVSDGSYDFVKIGDKNHGSGHYGYKGAYRHQVGFKWLNQWTGAANYVKFAYPINPDRSLDQSKPIFTCLGCHFAHGTNNQYWLDYVEQVNNGDLNQVPEDLDELDDMKELYGSSALKRLPNMGICDNCHDKSNGNNKDTIGGQYYY